RISQTKLLLEHGGPVRGEDPVRKLKVKQPVRRSMWDDTGAVHEILSGVISEDRSLHPKFVVLDADDVHGAEVERIQVCGVLRSGIMPEHHPLGGESALKCILDGDQISHSLPPVPGSS